MRLVTQLRFLIALMLALTLGGAALAIWSFHKSSFHVERINLAHSAHSSVLSLKSHTFQLFKQFSDDFVIGDRDEGKRKAELIATIRQDIADVRAAIGAEIELVGEEEIEELESLAKIENKIEDLIATLERASTTIESPTLEDWLKLSRLIDVEIDQDFFTMISGALAEEQEEVQETRETVVKEIALYRSLAVTFAVLALLAAFTSIWAISRSISRPLESLLAGVKKFHDGDLDHRVQLRGKNEIADIGATFNMMAERVSERTESLTSENLILEEAVTNRTKQLEKLLEDLRQSDANRRRMLADVSHELRTPLTIIKGEADIALRGGNKTVEDYRDALVRARDAATHTARLVDDLLFVARNESGHVRLDLKSIDLRSVLRDAAETFGSDVALLSDVDAAPIQGDEGRLKQAFLVLLENARHHGGQEIVMRLVTTPDGYRAAVEDDGPGMSDVEKDHAFERFFRGSNAAERYSDGAGLGLPVARSIVEAHGGKIELSDRPEGGLVAALFLPSRPKLKAVA